MIRHLNEAQDRAQMYLSLQGRVKIGCSLSVGTLSILRDILVETHFLLQVSDLLLIACILLHPVTSHVSEELHSDSQIDHQIVLILTASANASASFFMLHLTANVGRDVLLDA
jgi:hypothetical protein